MDLLYLLVAVSKITDALMRHPGTMCYAMYRCVLIATYKGVSKDIWSTLVLSDVRLAAIKSDILAISRQQAISNNHMIAVPRM